MNNFPSLKKIGVVHNVPFKLKHKDGNYIDISLEGRSGYNADGSFKQTYCVFQDVTKRLKVEEALLQSEKRYKDLVEMLPESIIETDANFNIIYANERGLEMTGYSEEDIKKGLNGLDFFTEESRERALKNIESRLEGNDPGQTEYMARKKDGTIYPILFHANSIMQDGKFTGLRSFIMDITERKLAENALRESEIRFKDLVEMLPEAVVETDANLNLTYVNKRGIELSGYSEKEVKKGLNGLTLLTPESRIKAKEYFRLRLEGKNPGTVEYYAQKKDGTIYPILFHANSLVDNGKTIGIRGLIVDITERKLAEQEIRESEARFRNAITHTPFPLMIHADGKVLQLSNEWVKQTGYSIKDIPTIKDWVIKAYGEDAVPSNEFIKKLYDIEKAQHDGEWEVKIKDGTIRLWDFSTSPIGKSANGDKMVISMASDITERKEAEAVLKKRMNELEIFNDAAVDRELVINDLRKEINEMLKEQGKEAVYDVAT